MKGAVDGGNTVARLVSEWTREMSDRNPEIYLRIIEQESRSDRIPP